MIPIPPSPELERPDDKQTRLANSAHHAVPNGTGVNADHE